MIANGGRAYASFSRRISRRLSCPSCSEETVTVAVESSCATDSITHAASFESVTRSPPGRGSYCQSAEISKRAISMQERACARAISANPYSSAESRARYVLVPAWRQRAVSTVHTMSVDISAAYPRVGGWWDVIRHPYRTCCGTYVAEKSPHLEHEA